MGTNAVYKPVTAGRDASRAYARPGEQITYLYKVPYQYVVVQPNVKLPMKRPQIMAYR